MPAEYFPNSLPKPSAGGYAPSVDGGVLRSDIGGVLPQARVRRDHLSGRFAWEFSGLSEGQLSVLLGWHHYVTKDGAKWFKADIGVNGTFVEHWCRCAGPVSYSPASGGTAWSAFVSVEIYNLKYGA